MLKLKLQLWLPHGKSWLIWKDPDAGRDCGQEEKGTTEDEMVGWHHWWTWIWVDSRSWVDSGSWVDSESWWWTGRPGVLRFMGSQRVGHDWATELNWTDTSIKMEKSRTLIIPNACKDVEQLSLFILHCWWEKKWNSHGGRQLAVSKCTLTIWFRILSLGIYPKELKTYNHTKTCTQICIATLFIIAKISFSKWMDELWYFQTTDYI